MGASDFPFFTWIGMLFSAGFGVGLVFWGVAEPMSHYFNSPIRGIESQSEQAGRIAMGYSFFHWGISQWAIFGIVGLVIGFLQFRKKMRHRADRSVTKIRFEVNAQRRADRCQRGELAPIRRGV